MNGSTADLKYVLMESGGQSMVGIEEKLKLFAGNWDTTLYSTEADTFGSGSGPVLFVGFQFLTYKRGLYPTSWTTETHTSVFPQAAVDPFISRTAPLVHDVNTIQHESISYRHKKLYTYTQVTF